MNRRHFLAQMGAWSLSMSSLLAPAAKPTSDKPHFLFILADDCTFRDIGCYGGQAKTPHIDRLATQGMRFTRCFQSAPMCSPTRHNLYTGLYPVKSGAYPNHTFVKEGTQSVVHYLRPLGYRVALSGKRHIAPQAAFPFEYSGKKNNPDMAALDVLMGECKATDTPFCIFACSNEPHTPWNQGHPADYDADQLTLPPTWVDTPETRDGMTQYLAEITYFDTQVGQCLALLDKHGLADKTLVMVASEQGSTFPFAKWTCYDTGLQSALIARWPGQIRPGSVCDALMEYGDVLPTFIEAAGGRPPEVLDGRSLLPVLRGESKTHKDYVYGEMTTRGIIDGSDYYGIRSIRSDRYKYIWNFTPEIAFRNTFMKGKIYQSWERKAASDPDAAEKIRRFTQRPGEELYDTQADPLEWNNLAGDPKYAEIQADLRRRLLEWMQSMGDRGQATELEAKSRQKRG